MGDYLRQSHRGVWRGDFPLLAAGGRPVHTEWSLSTHVEPGLSMAVVTDIGQAATDDHLYKSETKCLTGDQVREMKAKGGSKLAAAPAATPGSQAAKP